ncbi:MAG: sugar phosphate nucleotidyltransferase [Granulosicoccus sp.]
MNPKMPVTSAILLAAGRGTRLQPYTDNTPKPLLVHRGRPTLDYLLDSLLEAGVTDVVLVANHLSDQIEQYASLRCASHSQRVSVAFQAHLAGTAHALESAMEQFPDIVSQSFVLSASDYLVPRAFFSDLLGFHAGHDVELSVSMKALDEEQMAGRSSIRFLDDQSIAEIVEKPAPGTAPSSIGANLTFVLPASIAAYVDDVPVSRRGEREVQQAINSWLRQGGKARGLLQDVPPEWQKPR